MFFVFKAQNLAWEKGEVKRLQIKSLLYMMSFMQKSIGSFLVVQCLTSHLLAMYLPFCHIAG